MTPNAERLLKLVEYLNPENAWLQVTNRQLATLMDTTPQAVVAALRRLREAGVVEARTEGRRRWLRLNRDLADLVYVVCRNG
jgi:DNA-binding transcriptional ArsR family regulator